MRLIILLTFLSGCTTIKEMPTSELWFHAMNAVDTHQTIYAGSKPECYREANGIANAFLGDSPEPLETIVYMAAWSVLYHWTVQKWPDAPAAKFMRAIWVVDKTKVVHDNYQTFRSPC